MSSKIKYTVVPENVLEDALYESGVILTDAEIVISPLILFNDTMDLGLNDIYEEEIGISEDDIKYIDEDELMNCINEYKDEDFGNCVILNGFELSLDYVREQLLKISNEFGILFSINIPTTSRKYTSFTVYIDATKTYSDKEWDEYKKKYEKLLEESKEEDVEENKILTIEEFEDEGPVSLDDFLFEILGIEKEEVEEIRREINEDKTKILPKPRNNKNYQSYAFEDENSMIVIDKDNGILTIATEDGEVKIPDKHTDFIIDTLEKLKYNK